MHLKHLVLQNFRNHETFNFEFKDSQTVFVALNGSGKTNILEAIFLLATGETFRDAKVEELVRFEAEVAHIGCKVTENRGQGTGDRKNIASLELHTTLKLRTAQQNDNTIRHSGQSSDSLTDSESIQKDEETELRATLTRGIWQGKRVAKKKYQVNGVPRSKAKFVGNFQVVSFRPEDLRIVEGSPGRRRKFLDQILIQIDRQYAVALVTYGKALRQRNKLLEMIREQKTHPRALEYWDDLVIKHGTYINQRRQELIEAFNSDQVSGLSGQNFEYEMVYDHSMISRERLDRYKDRELGAGHTLVGPHRDDFQINGQVADGGEKQDLAKYGSRGQQRMCVLWLKIQALEFMNQQTKAQPILLLDDIFSELDHQHRELVFSLMQKYQTIATTADQHYVEGVEARVVNF